MGEIVFGVLIPFIGTSLGAFMVFFMKKDMNRKVEKILLGFAAGVMVAASIWSLLIPAIEQSESMASFSWVPATIGFILGMMFLFVLDSVIPHLHIHGKKAEGVPSKFKRSTMLVFSVTLHNIPEGMAIGVVFANVLYGSSTMTISAAIVLAIGIAIQNFPEGAIISMPIQAEGTSKGKSFLYGVLSGVVEPIAAVITILLAQYVIPILPYLLAFAAGAMFYVVIEEVIPESQNGEHSNLATIGFMVGFVLMMVLDVALG